MAHTLLSRLGRLGLAFGVALALLVACLGLVSLAAWPVSMATDWRTRTSREQRRSRAPMRARSAAWGAVSTWCGS
jgi:hypothetical protein